ncbi:MAG: sugar ABC transporter ATP-binding protein [Chloroflexota bacterium]|nr:MAG: sugar ABC transporter ATP-binding protein [Chloroflexota bacterium]
MAQEFLRVENISKHFAGVTALEDVSFSIGEGEIRCLVGENGSGKSTLIKIIAGVYSQDEGEVIIKGEQRHSLKPIDAIHAGIQVIYQDFSLFPNLTAAENISLNRQLASGRRLVNWRETRSTAARALERIGVNIYLDAEVEQLSVADRQLIAISRALMQDARLIIMDEPTTALTQREVESLFHVVRNLRDMGISILFVSHKLSEVQEIADSVMILRNGHKVADQSASELDLAKMAYYMTGREITESGYTYEAQEDAPVSLLKVEGLSRPGGFWNVSFDLKPGEIIGITGLLGSGRTELALALFGVQPATRGKISIDSKPVRIRSIQDAMQAGIGYVPDDRLTEGLFLEQSIHRNLVVRVIDNTLGRANLLSSRKMNDVSQTWVERLNIKTADTRLPVTSLSGGNQQRVVLAKWLAANPRILIMNGPTVGVDIGSKNELHELIKDLARQEIGVLIMSDDIPELMHTCNRILLMRNGQIIEEFATEEITEETLNLKLTEAVN